jgi:hypothetical protein
MTDMFRWILTVMLLSAPLAHFSSSAQSNPNSTIKEQNEFSPIICGYTCMTIISVRVSGKNGKKATDLRLADFTIYENGVKQEIYDFMRVESSEKSGSQTVYKMGYVPMDEYVDSKFRKLTVKIQTKDGRRLKSQVFPKGYVAKKKILN